MFSEFTSLVKSNFKHTSIFYFCSILLFLNITSNCKAQLTAEWASVPIGIGNNYGYTISVDDFGNSYIAGTFTNDNLDFGNGVILSDSYMDKHDIFVAKYNNSGEAQWAKTFNTNTSTYFNDLIIKATPEGEVYIAGSYTNTEIDFGNEAIIQNDSDSEDIFLVKYNTDGETQWARSIGNSDTDKPKSLAIDSYGNIYIAGYYSSPYIFWGIIKGSLGPFYNKEVYLPIYTYNKGESDMFLAKYNRFGNLKWAKSFGDTGNDVASSLAFDVNGNLYLAGKSDGDFLIPGMETGDTYLIQFDDKGQINWLKGFAASFSKISISAKENIYLAGSYYNNSINFGNGVSLPESDIYQTQTCIVKFNNIGEAQWANKIDCIVEDAWSGNENTGASIALDNFEIIYI
ncbi:SBBP repeat-containing protein [Chondrinema litorale]|uniref:SBBP repeat-containing protein n=1 Tax=Chondrinema litorale TaxID=2994555 RepID=UPI0025432D08|nr:SBBP repeat-containing protein [Chondrinema litorale]UZR98288.1 SBBP repeat-containing protein [Chondrinema litorale]